MTDENAETFCEGGDLECPVCGAAWWEDDYWELSQGSCTECPECEASLEVTEMEHRVIFYLRREQKP